MFHITPLGDQYRAEIQRTLDNKTKPPGALGRLESLAMQLALITGPEKISLRRPTLLVFAGDHGIAHEGVSIAPPQVTTQMVHNFLAGGAAVNCFCRVNGWEMAVVDAGILTPIEHPALIQQSLGQGTANFAEAPAMSLDTMQRGLTLGADLARRFHRQGSNLFAFGEMGIGNTSSAAALLGAFSGLDAKKCVGRGTGVSDEVLARKISLVDAALKRHQTCFDDPAATLAALGGFEIVQMVGAMLAAAECGAIILVDGFIATAAALTAWKMKPEINDYLVFCHRSEEQAHRAMLEMLRAEPLLDLGLRLGEGTGAALALPLLRAAESFYNDMASFESAGVSAV